MAAKVSLAPAFSPPPLPGHLCRDAPRFCR